MSNDVYYRRLKKAGLIERAGKWLERNEPPRKWRASKWAWAYTDMKIKPFTPRWL